MDERTNEHHQSQTEKPVVLSEIKTDKPDALFARVAEVKASARAHVAQAESLLKKLEEHTSKPATDLAQVKAQLEALILNPAEDPDFLTKSHELLQNAQRAIMIALREQRDFEDQVVEVVAERKKLEAKLAELEKLTGLKKLVGLLEVRKLTAQQQNLNAQLEDLGDKVVAAKQAVQLISQGQQLIHNKQEVAVQAVVAEIQAIYNEYQDLANELQQDVQLTTEMRNGYLQQEIISEVERISRERNYPEANKLKFYAALKDCVDHRHDPAAEQRQYRTVLQESFDYETGFYDLMQQCNSLIAGADERLIQGFLAKQAAAEAAPIKELAQAKLSTNLRRHFGSGFSEIIRSQHGYLETNSFLFVFREEFNDFKNGSAYEDMRWWTAIKTSPLITELFNEFVHARDQEMYDIALSNSLADSQGEDIQMLYHYPTPDAIRNLLMIAAADMQSGGYRTIHANSVLTHLGQRPEWRTLLDEAEKKYPELVVARNVLEKWNYAQHTNNPEAKNVAGDLAARLFNDPQTDKRLAELARGSLKNEALLEVLGKREILTQAEIENLTQAGLFLQSVSEQAYIDYVKSNHEIRYFSAHSYVSAMRENLMILLNSVHGTAHEGRVKVMRRLELLSQIILKNKADTQKLTYLTDGAMIDRIQDSTLDIADFQSFVDAYKTVPELLSGHELLVEFAKQYQDENTVTFFQDLAAAYGNPDENDFEAKNTLAKIAQLIGEKHLTPERALELPGVAEHILKSDTLLYKALKFPELFLGTNEGIAFFDATKSAGAFGLEPELDIKIGEKVRVLQQAANCNFPDLLREITATDIENIGEVLWSDKTLDPSKLSWQQLLMGYSRVYAAVFEINKFSNDSEDKLIEFFKDSKVRDKCLNGLRDQWLSYLNSGNPDSPPFSLTYITKFVEYCDGPGPLSQIETLNQLICEVDVAFSKETTLAPTKLAITQGLAAVEERFGREKWSNVERTDFSNVTRDIVAADPSILADQLKILEKFSPAQAKFFIKEIYPLYRTKLVMIEQTDQRGNKSFAAEKLREIQADIFNFSTTFSNEGAFEAQKAKLLDEITALFKNRFGIAKVPETFDAENIRSLTNVSMYLANLSGRTPDKEAILGFYLSLMMNGQWNEFKRGGSINPAELLTPEKAQFIERFLADREGFNPITPENLGLQPEEMPDFYRLLQQEDSNVVMSNIETIDVKLNNVVINLEGLKDPDLYPDQFDKQRMQILLTHGSKKIGAVAANMYQELGNPAKVAQLDEVGQLVKTQITQALQERGLPLTQQTLKESFQDGIKPFATVANLIGFVAENRVVAEVETLRSLLYPSPEVISVFTRLGEEFKPSSGAAALSQDLNYLDNLIVKKSDDLSVEEKTLLTEYIAKIRTQMTGLESLYTQIKNKVTGLKQTTAGIENPLLKAKLDEMERVISAQVTEQAITSTVTDNLNEIIENIRECLACTNKGGNNDTDLTFGDQNKFYLYSKTEAQNHGSIADQVVFVEPITRADSTTEMAFVLDRLYGTNTPTVLENQVDTIIKKQRIIKQRFPNVKLSIFVTDSALMSAGTSPEMFLEKYKVKTVHGLKNVHGLQESVDVTVAESATGDHYIEFGGDSRTAGKRNVSGIIFSV